MLLFEPSDLPKPFVFSSGLHFNAPRMSFNDGGGSTWPTGKAAENLREARLARGGGWREEHISLHSSSDLDVQKEETSADLTSTHLLRVELKTRWKTGSLFAFSKPIWTRGFLGYKWRSCWAKQARAAPPLVKSETLRVIWSVGRPRKLLYAFGTVCTIQGRGGGLVFNDHLVTLVAPSSPCDISLVRWTQPDSGPTALGSPVWSPVWHTSHTSLSAISHSELNIT